MLKFDKDPKTDGGKFIKLKDGETVMGILRGTVEDFYVLWDNKVSTRVPEGTPKAKFRFRVNLVTMDAEGNLEAKILEQGPTLYKSLKELSQDYDLEKTVIKIKRSGSGLNDTEYAIIPLPKQPSDKTLKALESLQLLPLEDDAHVPASGMEDTVPF
jgi:hypothetical protein